MAASITTTIPLHHYLKPLVGTLLVNSNKVWRPPNKQEKCAINLQIVGTGTFVTLYVEMLADLRASLATTLLQSCSVIFEFYLSGDPLFTQ